MRQPPKKRGPNRTRKSPLYTSKNRELEKRQIVAASGRDLDGAYRARRRLDQPA